MKYEHLLSPLRIGNVILKNRLFSTKSQPHFLQGPEPFPTESAIAYYAGIAKNGAAVVTCKIADKLKLRESYPAPDLQRMPWYDADDPAVDNYFSMMADAIHFYRAKASISLHDMEPRDLDFSDGQNMKQLAWRSPKRIMTRADMEAMIDRFVGLCLRYQKLGFDMCSLYMPYRASILSAALSPLTNHRQDEYGGPMVNRARFPLELCAAIKAACGQDFLIEAHISGDEGPGGNRIEDTVEFARLAEGKIDILHIRGRDGNETHPTGFNSVEGEHATLRVAEAIKKSGAKIVVAPNGGYRDPDECERLLREGKADMFAMARAFISDPDYITKITEERTDDIVPCLQCNKCHVPHMDGPWVSICSVNPKQGIQYLLPRTVTPPAKKLRVAVIGGGPAGLNAALYCRERGHEVTLFEKDEVLGGQMRHADSSRFKWPLKKYKDYLIYQVGKQQVEVHLGTPATPELIRDGGYDAVIAAVGAVPKLPPISGAEAPGIWNPQAVYAEEKNLGKNVVVVGGSQTGVETAMYLADAGHRVTVLTRQNELICDAPKIHYSEILEEVWSGMEGFSFVTGAKTVSVTPGSVDYIDSAGAARHLDADSVVLCGGMEPLQQLAMSFAGTAPRFFIIGDAQTPGCIHDCTRAAYAAACEL